MYRELLSLSLIKSYLTCVRVIFKLANIQTLHFLYVLLFQGVKIQVDVATRFDMMAKVNLVMKKNNSYVPSAR